MRMQKIQKIKKNNVFVLIFIQYFTIMAQIKI